MKPLKPVKAATSFVGKFDESVLSFLPENSSYRDFVTKHDFVTCHSHVLDGGKKYINYGNDIVVSKWPVGGRNGVAVYTVRFYCSVICQRNDALAIRANSASKT